MIALATYLAASLALLGRSIAGHLLDSHIGSGADPATFIWSMAWFPYALGHRLNPLLTDYVWTPHGLNLTWMTAVPGASIAMWPVTAVVGPVASYNIICLLASPLAAWTAFLLCRQISGAWWPSLIGGYLFGFSAYLMGQIVGGHPHLTLVFLVPLAVLIIVRALAGQLSRTALVAALAAILAGQFLISVEVFATMTVMGALVALLGYSFASQEIRARLRAMVLPVALAYGLSMLVLSPFLYCMLAGEWPRGPLWSLAAYSVDMLNFVVPTPTSVIGTLPALRRLTTPFSSYGLAEVDAYVGLPMLAVTALYVRGHWREPLGRVLLDSLVITSVLALGPRLHVHGADYGGLPGKILPLVPLLNKALPARFMMFSFLVLSVIAALWLASVRPAAQAAVGLLLILATFPNPASKFWVVPNDAPKFFAASCPRDLKAGETVLVLPFGNRGDSMLWQAQCQMRFRLAGGWTAVAPADFADWPIYDAFLNATYVPEPGAQLAAFIAHHGITTVIVADRGPDVDSWNRLVSSIIAGGQHSGDVNLYRVPESALKPYASATASAMRQRSSTALLDALVRAADRWLAEGNSLSSLTPRRAQHSGLLPTQWMVGPSDGFSIVNTDLPIGDARYAGGAWLGATNDGMVGVGVYGPRASIALELARYQPYAAHIYARYPQDALEPGAQAPPADASTLTVIEFARAPLAAAAARVAADSSR